MQKNLTLFYSFIKSLMLINRQIIKYATLFLKLSALEGQPIYKLNNPNLLMDHEDDDKEVIIGAYEADYCVEFIKLIRKEFFFSFLKSEGTFKIEFDEGRIFGIHERLLRLMLCECGFQYNLDYTDKKITYTVTCQ